MALPVARLERLIWIAGPCVLYFGLQAFKARNLGDWWGAVGYALMALLLACGPWLMRDRVITGRAAAAYVVAIVAGFVAWDFATSTSMRVIGLALVLAAQASMMMTARRHGVPAPRVRDDEPVRIGPL